MTEIIIVTDQEQALIKNGLLTKVVNKHGEEDLRCTICTEVGTHGPLCAVGLRLKVGLR